MKLDNLKIFTNKLLRNAGFKIIKFDESEYDYRNIILKLIKNNSDIFHGDILEIGASGWNIHNYISDPKAKYSALDLRNGPNIDIVGNVLTLSQDLNNRKFDTIVCLETLEHVTDPHKAVEEIYNCLNVGGYLFASTPFFYEIHGEKYGDYWRFTRQGWRELLKKFSDTQITHVGINELKPHHYIVLARK